MSRSGQYLLSKVILKICDAILGDMASHKKTLTAEKIGENVKAARQRLGMTQDALANKIGVTPDAVRKVEAGKRAASWLSVAKFADALQSCPNHLLGFDLVPPEGLIEALKPILAAYGQPSEDADSIARILLEAIRFAQYDPEAGPVPDRYKMAARLLIAQSQSR